jgi:hypothetical protein
VFGGLRRVMQRAPSERSQLQPDDSLVLATNDQPILQDCQIYILQRNVICDLYPSEQVGSGMIT